MTLPAPRPDRDDERPAAAPATLPPLPIEHHIVAPCARSRERLVPQNPGAHPFHVPIGRDWRAEPQTSTRAAVVLSAVGRTSPLLSGLSSLVRPQEAGGRAHLTRALGAL